MSLDHTIHAYFVSIAGTSAAGNNETVAKNFDKALSVLRNHIPEDNIRQIKANEGYTLIASGQLTKKDVFILDSFDGDFFKQLQQVRCLIVGPPCILTCISRCELIPAGSSPIYTTAMRDLHISASSITPAEKERIGTLIKWMGGYYFQNLGRQTTHLISNSIKSKKYEHATLMNIPVMHVDWVQHVWERSIGISSSRGGDDLANISAADTEFDKYRLPIFFGANVTCTGLDSERKNKVMRIVNENGGTYHRAFRSQLVDIVITEHSKTNSDKYKAALHFNKEILLPEWIFDSEGKGYALPTKEYKVRARKEVSTPTKVLSVTQLGAADQTQLDDISRISYPSGGPRMLSYLSAVNETTSSLNTSAPNDGNDLFAAPQPKSAMDLLRRSALGSGTYYRNAYEEISMRMMKKAGNFLDGCCIYLSGFLPEEREKLHRILNAGGATRYDEPNNNLTHIIIGQLEDSEFRAWQRAGLVPSVHIVRLDWLLESIKTGHIAGEAIYRVPLPTPREPDMPSPSSKRTLRSMNHSFKQPDKPIKKKLFESGKESLPAAIVDASIATAAPMANSTEMPVDHDEHSLIAQYSQELVAAAGAPLPPAASSLATPVSPHAPPVATSTQLRNDVLSSRLAPSNPTLLENFSNIDLEKLDYFHGASIYVEETHFTGDYYTQLVSECDAAHGNIVTQTFSDPVDYIIVSFERTLDASQLPVKARHIVTELYVECCMKANQLVPIEYYHKHIPHTADSKPLRGMTVVVSLYSGMERDFIDSVAQLMGAKVNKNFMKKEKPLLVCSSPEGSKYEGAIKWGYPVVNAQWLVQCAIAAKKLTYREHLVGSSVQDFPPSPQQLNKPTSTTTPKRNAMATMDELPLENMCVRAEDAPSSETYATATPARHTLDDITPLCNKRVAELVGVAGGGGGSVVVSSAATSRNPTSGGEQTLPDSPHTPTNNFAAHAKNKFDFLKTVATSMDSEVARQCLLEMIEEMKQNQTPELERIRRQACTPINGKVRTPIGIPEFCHTPEYQKRMADDFERRWRLPIRKVKPDTPIDEIRQRLMRITCETMNIPYDDIAGDKPTSSSRSIKSKQLMSPNAKAKPKPTTLHVDEVTPIHRKYSSNVGRSLFAHNNASLTARTPGSSNANTSSDTFVPSTQSPMDASVIGLVGQRVSVGKSTINFDKISFEETAHTTSNATTTQSDKVEVHTNDTTMKTPTETTAIGEAAAAATLSLSSSAAAAATSASTSSPEFQRIQEYLKSCETRRASLKRTHSNRDDIESDMDTQSQFVQPFESEQFCMGTEHMVEWHDPSDYSARRRTRLSLAPMQYPGKPCFSISSADDKRSDLIDKITQLGGEICANLINYDANSTHFVCEMPNRSEKMLGSIAAGKWVLSTKYIEECAAREAFIDEELFEWGNAKGVNLPTLTADDQMLAAAAHRWRIELRARKGGAFDGFHALISVAERSTEAIKTVLRAGGATIVEAKPPFSLNEATSMATHCFVDMRKAPLSQQDYQFLKGHNVLILSQMYINAYITNGENVDQQKYLLQM